MDTSIFTDKEVRPEDKDLENALGSKYKLWQEIKLYTLEHLKNAFEEWTYSKFGWSYKIKDKKRAIVYFMPYDQYFRVSMVYGEKAFKAAMDSNISDEIKKVINDAPVYAEGRGFRVDLVSAKIARDIKTLVNIKLQH